VISKQLFTYSLQGRINTVLNDSYTSGNLSSRERTSYQYNSGFYRVHLITETGTTLSPNAVSETWSLKSETSFLADSHNHTGYTQTIRETKVENGHTLITDYTFGNDEILQRVHGTKADGTSTDETFIFGHDGHGSVRHLSDLAGVINQVATYAAYGAVIAVHNVMAQLVGTSESSFKSTLGYSGEAWDTNVQQQYLRARFYNPVNGRFDRSDDFAGNKQDPQSLHKYAYVHGDPIGHNDPTGMFAGLVGLLGSMSIGSSNQNRSNRANVNVLRRAFGNKHWKLYLVVGKGGGSDSSGASGSKYGHTYIVASRENKIFVGFHVGGVRTGFPQAFVVQAGSLNIRTFTNRSAAFKGQWFSFPFASMSDRQYLLWQIVVVAATASQDIGILDMQAFGSAIVKATLPIDYSWPSAVNCYTWTAGAAMTGLVFQVLPV
jgi:RHS repeat-associated protein